MSLAKRVIHLTFPKCGSQWVRDVLTAPEVVAHSRTPLHPASLTLLKGAWPEQPPGTFIGPIYDATYHDWAFQREPGDKAVVVLRDPRDLGVSLIHSMCFSHRPGPHVDMSRSILLKQDSRTRLLYGIDFIVRMSRGLYSWGGRATNEWEYVTRYETLLAESKEEFSRIAQYLGWEIPEPVLAGVVHRLSFAERSGRAAGQEDVFSHYRKGVAGDWRRHFDRELGRVWESVLPDLLCSLGYETSSRWFEELPEQCEQIAGPESRPELANAIQLQAEIVRVREENGELRKACAAFQAHIGGLDERIAGLEERLKPPVLPTPPVESPDLSAVPSPV